MNVIIPLGGLGERFLSHDYKDPKPLINALTKPILQWVIDSLLQSSKSFKLYIPYNSKLEKYDFERLVKEWYPEVEIHCMSLKAQTRGAIETVYLTCKNLIDNDSLVVCVDGDTFYTCDVLSSLKRENSIVTFEETHDYEKPPYSYVKSDSDSKVYNIAEKNKISNNACSGIYCFYSKEILLSNFEPFAETMSQELYTSLFVKYLITQGYEFSNVRIQSKDVHNLGTPLHLQIFCNNYPIHSLYSSHSYTPKRICFDLDNTLVTNPLTPGDYSTVQPIERNIQLCNYLKKLGHTIIIHTARRMKTHEGNVGKLMADIGAVTFASLSKFNIQYDEIYFGKPYADYYIDDKALNCNENMEKALGCYTSVSPRHFNVCELNTYETIKKRSDKGLYGEIYYYKNIPDEIKDMFPMYFGSASSNEYEIEKINGITVSKQLINNSAFVIKILPEIFKSLTRIHSCTCHETFDIQLQDLYTTKLQERFSANFNFYSKLDGIQEIYDHLLQYFSSHVPTFAKLGVIHGDPVFTNIIINNFGKFKFIDMRGSVGTINTIRGDIYYDYGKLYQSIIGYDFILNNHPIDPIFVSKCVQIFKDLINNKEVFLYIQYITLSLLFSLLPLHNNDERIPKYIKLMNDLYNEIKM